jgi:hypothetical protein
MTRPVVIADSGGPDRPYSHLLPIVEAEESWGNRVRSPFQRDRDGWRMSMEHPLHVDQLRNAFVFPPHIEVGRTPDGDTYVVDSSGGWPWCQIWVVNPNRTLGPASPRPGLLSRLFGR